MPTKAQKEALADLRRIGAKRQRQRAALNDLNAEMRDAVIFAWSLGIPKSHIATAGHLSRQSVHTFTDNAEPRGTA